MKPGWSSKPFEECIEKVDYTSKIQRNAFLEAGDYPIVSQEEGLVNGYWDDDADLFRISKPVVIFGDHTKVLKFVDFDFVLGADGVKVLDPKAFLLPKFFYYQLSAANLDSLGYARHYKLLKELEIYFPSGTEQKRIVDILDEAFDGIATAKANAEKSLQNTRELFESHLESIFTAASNKWTEYKLGDESLMQIIDGDRGVNYPKASDFHEEGYCLFLNTKNVRPDGFLFESVMFVSKEKDAQLRKGKLQRNDVVMTTRGTIGNLGLYSGDIPYDHIRINSGMLILRANPKKLLPTFLFELLRSQIVRRQIQDNVSGAAQPQLPIKTLVNFSVPVPDKLSDQVAIVARVNALEAEARRLESIYQQKLAALDELKKSLLHQAFSGKL